MNRNLAYIIIGIIIIAAVGYFLINNNDDSTKTESKTVTSENAQEEDSTASSDTPSDAASPSTSASIDQPIANEPALPDGNDVSVFEITYNGESFSPSQLTINNGDIVVFKNESSEDFWPASGPHPVHTNYPEFDPKEPIPAGGKWQFKFTKTGEWPFHNHLNSSITGKITVK